MSNSVHSRLSASGAHRWMNCPGSVVLSEKVPQQESSIYAREGTAAHKLCEQCLALDMMPQDFIGEKVEDFEITEEMAEAVKAYVDFVKAVAPYRMITSKGCALQLEVKFSLPEYHKDIAGTADCVVTYRGSNTIIVADYKHGKGVVVEPENNPQLMIYALGAAKVAGLTEGRIRIVVVQPRAYHESGEVVRGWWTTVEELKAWAEKELKPAAEKASGESSYLETGDYCRFCRGSAVCPKMRDKALEVAKAEFNKPVFPEPKTLTVEEISKALTFAEMMSNWLKGVKAYAQGVLESGEEVPGFKLVAKRSNRKWVSDEEAEELLINFIGEDAYEKKLLSVAKAEKALKNNGLDISDIEDLWEKPDNGLVIAPVSDKRTAVKSSAVLDFKDSVEFLQ